MRMIHCVALIALIVAPVAATAATPLQLEISVWQAFKDKNAKAFSAMIAPNYVSIYAQGPGSLATDLKELKNSTTASFKIANFTSRMVDADDLLTTYSVDVKGTVGKADISGRYWSASLWHRTGNKWLTAYHTEVKAQ